MTISQSNNNNNKYKYHTTIDQQGRPFRQKYKNQIQCLSENNAAKLVLLKPSMIRTFFLRGINVKSTQDLNKKLGHICQQSTHIKVYTELVSS